LDHHLTALQCWANKTVDVVGTICRIEQCFRTRSDEAFAVQHNVAKLNTEIGAPGLPGQYDSLALGFKPRRQKVDLGRFPRPVSPLEGDEQPSHR
jgi:hypothetical protein